MKLFHAIILLGLSAMLMHADEAAIPSCFVPYESSYGDSDSGMMRIEGVVAWTSLEPCQPRHDGISGIWADVAEKSPDKPRGWINLGLDYQKLGRFDKAIQSFQKAQMAAMRPDIDPHQAQMARIFTTMNMSDIYSRNGQPETAHQILKAAWLQDPGFPGYAVNLSLFYIREQQPEKAVWIAGEGIDSLENYKWFLYAGQLYLNRGEAYRFMGKCEEAAADYAMARKDHDIYKLAIPACVPVAGN